MSGSSMDLKFQDTFKTAKGEERGFTPFQEYKTLWFNTGTLCNLTCENCYIESSPKNDRLQYLELNDVKPFLQELKESNPNARIGFTGGEPFLNPHFVSILENSLELGFNTLTLTNAHKAINRSINELERLNRKFPNQISLRVSLDHYTKEIHEKERGPKTFDSTLNTMAKLSELNFQLSLAARSLTNEDISEAKKAYQNLLEEYKIPLKLNNDTLVIFPEMSLKKDVPEITTACWDILNKPNTSPMCSSERMVVRKKDEPRPVVLACTLLAYEKEFEMGHSLKEASKKVYLNHPFCAQFCVLGGASCSST